MPQAMLWKMKPDGGMLYFAEAIQEVFNHRLYCVECRTQRPENYDHSFSRESKGKHEGKAYRSWKSDRSEHARQYWRREPHPVFDHGLKNEQFIENAYKNADTEEGMLEKLNTILVMLIKTMKNQSLDCGKLVAIAKRKNVDWRTHEATQDDVGEEKEVQAFNKILYYLQGNSNNSDLKASAGDCLNAEAAHQESTANVAPSDAEHESIRRRRASEHEQDAVERSRANKRPRLDELDAPDSPTISSHSEALNKVAHHFGVRFRKQPTAESVAHLLNIIHVRLASQMSNSYSFLINVRTFGNKVFGMTALIPVTIDTTARELAEIIKERVKYLDIMDIRLDYHEECIWNGRFSDGDAGVDQPIIDAGVRGGSRINLDYAALDTKIYNSADYTSWVAQRKRKAAFRDDDDDMIRNSINN